MKKWKVLFALTLGLLCVSGSASAATNVTVGIPTFPVELNGVAYDNQHAQYPLIIYKDITYFPMTFSLTRELGLITGWDNTKGLYIVQHPEECTTTDKMNGNNKAGVKYSAVLPDYPLHVNGFAVNNSAEPYPILNFRNITYFPLTWHYAHDEFGWDVQWDQKTGLKIDSHHNGDGNVALYQDENGDVVLRKTNDYSKEVEEEGFVFDKRVITDYRLNTEDNTVTKMDAGKDYNLYGIPMQEISDEFAIEGNALRYKGNVILSGLGGELLENPLVFAGGYSTETATLLSVRLLYHAEVPAPYTPRVEYAFVEDKTGVHRVETWNENDYAMRFSETDSAYYIGSLGRGIAGTRFGINMSTIVKKDKATGQETVLNPLYDKNAGLEMIGVYDNKLYVRACWFGTDEDTQRPDYYYSRVNPARDGFYTIDKNNHFERVGEYMDGTPFLTKDGKLYVSADSRLDVVDVINQQRVTVK